MKFKKLKKGDKFRLSPKGKSSLTFTKVNNTDASSDQGKFGIKLSGDSEIIHPI